MKVLDLFSGIGGFSLGLEAAGMETIAFCEREKFCQKVLKSHWPDVPIYDDVRTLDGSIFNGVDLVCGGYPCQPFSVAGKQLGHADERHLWPEMLRIIQGSKPRWVIAENVAGHIKLGFDEVAVSLETEGFTVWPLVIPACAVDAPHRRDRLWILGYSQHNGSLSHASHASNFGCEGSVGEKVQRERTFSREPSGSFTQWANGWPISSPRICGVDDGIPNRTHRLKALGNAVVPQIPFIIGQAIMEYENDRS